VAAFARCSSLLAAVVLVFGLAFALPASAPAASFTFTTIDVPGAFSTEAFGINAAGQIVGTFDSATGQHGFLYSGGVFTPFDVPGASFTVAFGNNATGQIVGFFQTNPLPGTHGFLDTGGVFTTIDVPVPSAPSVPSALTNALGINAAGQIVGTFGTVGARDGFLDIGGVLTTIDVRDALFGTEAFGINASGQIVGDFNNATLRHGFLDTGGVFTTIDVPGGVDTAAFGINATGQIVGVFLRAISFPPETHGFLDTGGVFTTIDVPGASATEAFGINDMGQIVGFFDDATAEHGFLATPAATPAPSTLLLLGTGLAFGAAWKRIRRRRGLDRTRSAFALRSFLLNN
jgi:probable HAF family extracellular repeat protein